MATSPRDRLGLGRLERVDPKSIWRHEARELTPWLLENLDLLGDALGIEIVPTQRAEPTGNGG